MCLFVFILLFFSASASAQTLQGIVTDAGTGQPLYRVTVINMATQAATFTDEHGLYFIAAKPGNVIAFSFIGYKTVSKEKPPSTIVASLNVSMEHSAFQLKEF